MSEIPAPNLEGAVPSHLPVLPLKSTVVFPRIFIPLSVGRKKSLHLLEDLTGVERHIAVATQLDESAEEVGFKDLHHVGTMVRVQHLLKLPDGTVQLAVLGLRRLRLTEPLSEEPYLTCGIEMMPESMENFLTIEREALMRRAISSFQQLVTLAPHLPAELAGAAGAIDDPLHLANYIANHIRLTTEQRQEILELDSAKAKLERLLGHMAHELEVLELGRKIQSQAEEQMGKAQREYFLREQLKAIQRELGELDTEHAELSELRERIEKAGLPPEAKREADREIARLERIPSASPESSVIRTYLELIVSLPWNLSTGGEVDVKKARGILDADHYDLDKVKQRIVEHLAVRRLKQQRGATEHGREPILCFVGPPGVGKTSLGQSIARAMGRKFARASLGGVHDEAEIRGHRRTYIGAMPGRILQAIRRAESNDPVFMLDEVDKIGGLARRPFVGSARSPRPRAEQGLPRQLPGRAFRPVEDHVHHHGQHAGHDSSRAARPHGGSPPLGLHGRGEGADRGAVPDPEATPCPWFASGRDHHLGGGDPVDHPRVHPRGWRAQPRARDRLDPAA